MLVGLLGGAAPAFADAVTDWNEITVQAITVGRPVPSASSTSRSCRLRCTMPCRPSTGNSSPITPRSERSRRGQGPSLGCRRRGGARCARRHVPRTGDHPRHDVLQLPGGQGSHWRSRDPHRTAGRRAYSSAAAREPESAAAAVCRWKRRWRLAADSVVSRKSARAGAVLADGDTVDGRLRSVHAHEPDAFSSPATAGADQRPVHAGLQRGQGDRLSRQLQTHRRTNRSRVFLHAKPRRCCGTARCGGSPRDTCARAATRRGCSRWRISRRPMRSSRVGTARRSTPSGGRSRRSRRATPTAIRRRSAIRRGSR